MSSMHRLLDGDVLVHHLSVRRGRRTGAVFLLAVVYLGPGDAGDNSAAES